ncbi:PhoPQ-activated pathogenicity-related family protein [Aureliella helgolandensis]|uniref:PhoPQ-activated pathogenicity-related protein n=1 Tax=Aureliella helgolandensis TaxID=2527968 RepID=A0A518GA79_9BACT|nr:PhoPQ-activated pathogenicity-related family protein [Aureliella helgolandensis]QDV25506.1 PhoPQ-activated pathogenicity-related protein [Aureliella helgolandensis]
MKTAQSAWPQILRQQRLCLCLAPLLLLQLFQHASAQEHQPRPTAIDRYVHQPDDAFRWKIVSSELRDGIHIVVVDMVSQRWLTAEQVDRTEWQHWVTLAIPEKPISNIGLLKIGGGKNGGDPPTAPSQEILQIAKATQTVVAELKMVPNQPLIFHGDGVPRSEDDLIGYTWDQYLKTGEPNWLARNAMIKSAVRAMDTMTAVTAEVAAGHELNQFVVAGGSKRGWTTWLTGAMDKRVVAIVPIVIDVLNTDKSMRHHFAAYGYWAPAIANYVQHHIMERIGDPRLAEAYRLIDPYYYRDRLTMPKLILNAAGDQFFLPDSSQFYWGDLQGEKHLRYVPNTDHGMDDSDAMQSLIAFYSMIVHDRPRPEYSWKNLEDGTTQVTTSTKPLEVRLWQAHNPVARDFRLETLGKEYTSQVLEAQPDGTYLASLPQPASGWTAYFVELTFDSGSPFPIKLTTNVQVTPNTLPYSHRDPAGVPSVTLKCELPTEADARRLLGQVDEPFKVHFGVEDLMTQQVGTTVYLNWMPNGFKSEVEAAMAWLASQKCQRINIQLEAGRHITATR